jgi:hypothetical protein
VDQWRQNWPLVKQGLESLLKILVNVLSSMAAMATPQNSRALWQVANPLLALAVNLSSHPQFVTALLYLVMISKGAGQLKSVFTGLKTGWGALAGVVSSLTSGKVSLGMQGAGDTMLVAARQMQVAADTMVGAAGAGGKAGAAGAATTAAAAGAGRTGALAVAGSIVSGVSIATVGYLALDWLSKHGQSLATKAYQAVLGKSAGAKAGSLFGGLGERFAEEFKKTGNPISAIANMVSSAAIGKLFGEGGSKAGKAFGDGVRRGTAGGGKAWSAYVHSITQAVASRAVASIGKVFAAQAAASRTANTALNNYTKAIYTNGLRSQATKNARDTLIWDMQQAGVKSKIAFRDVSAYTEAIRKNGYGSSQARAARQRLVDDIAAAFRNSKQGKADMERYTTAVRVNGSRSDAARSARKTLIRDLESSGLTSKEARRLVDNLTKAIKDIPTKHHTTVSADAYGRGKIIARERAVGRSATDILAFSQNANAARGLLVQGRDSGRDDKLVMARGGELMVPPDMVRRGLVDHLRGMIPGFGGGGVVGRALGKGPPWMGAKEGSFLRRELLDFMRREINDALSRERRAAGGYGGYGVAPNGPVQAYARKLLAARGWGNQWAAFNALVMGESGWNYRASNPSSGAYGIPQALPGSKMAAAGADWASNPYTQLRWMMGYIASVYRSPANAYSMWSARSPHWYGEGTPSARPGWAWVGEHGRPELVLFKGGEQVVPQDRASARFRGYAKGTAPASGPLVLVEHLHVRETADVDLIARRLAFQAGLS